MKRALTLTAIAVLAALALAGSPSAATAAKTHLTITVVGKISGGKASGTFTLLGASTAYSDSGRAAHTVPLESSTRKTPEGLTYLPTQRTETLKGKHGTLVIRSMLRLFDVAKQDDSVSTGTWSIVRGTGRYSRLRGGGALVGITQAALNASNFSDYTFSHRYEGSVTGT